MPSKGMACQPDAAYSLQLLSVLCCSPLLAVPPGAGDGMLSCLLSLHLPRELSASAGT